MGKVFKIVMWIIVLSVIYIWITTVFKACKHNAAKAAGEVVEGTEEMIDEASENIEEVSEELFEGGDEEDIDYSSSDDTDFEPIEEVEEIIEEEIVDETPPARYTKNTNTISEGQYMLIAGNYLVESNAKEMRNKLSNLGYSSVEVAIFDNSPYHTVIASRFTGLWKSHEVF